MNATSSSTNSSQASRRERVASTVLSALSIPLFFLLWEAISRSQFINIVLFPPPSIVVVSLLEWARSGQLFIDFGMSLSRAMVGFILGSSLGILFGVATGYFLFCSSLLTPIFQILRPIPPIAFVPIVILWFGLSEAGKYFLVFWGVFFTIWLSAHLGVQKVDPGLLRVAQSLGTPRRAMLREVIFPGALPYIVVGLRTAVSVAFYTLVAAELAGTFAGLAYRIDIAQQNLQIGQVMGGLVVLGATSFLADRGFAAISQRIVWWR